MMQGKKKVCASSLGLTGNKLFGLLGQLQNLLTSKHLSSKTPILVKGTTQGADNLTDTREASSSKARLLKYWPSTRRHTTLDTTCMAAE